MADIYLKQKDQLPILRATLSDENGPVDLTGGTVKVWFCLKAGGTPKSGNCTIVDEAGGIVEYAWASGDSDTAGDYNLEFVATLAGKTITFPNDGYLLLRVVADIDTGD